jgi:tetratricopeptide (TPR) repeat protein
VPFSADGLDFQDQEVSRDLGIALVFLLERGKIDPSVYQDRALRLLEAAARRDPADVEAREQMAGALMLRHRPAEALETLEAVLKQRPELETALVRAAMLAQSEGAEDRALGYWRRAVAANPWMPEYRAGLAPLLAQRGDWTEARTQCRDWLRLDPESAAARRLWIRCLLRSGDRQEARAEVDKLIALQPENRAGLETWFAEQQW